MNDQASGPPPLRTGGAIHPEACLCLSFRLSGKVAYVMRTSSWCICGLALLVFGCGSDAKPNAKAAGGANAGTGGTDSVGAGGKGSGSSGSGTASAGSAGMRNNPKPPLPEPE